MAGMQEAFALLGRYVEQQRRSAGTPAVVLALTDRDGLLHVGTHGFADLVARRAVTPDTLFEIGSISKSFTAMILLQLCESGRVDLHAPVTSYLPWFHIPSAYAPITLHHLLTHTAGIIRGTDFTTESRYGVWSLREEEAATPPGTRFHYSNVGYKALGLVLEEVLGQSYAEMMQERILDPLAMDSTDAVITHETRKRLAVGYEHFYDDRPAPTSPPLVPATWLETATADGSIAATAADLAAYLRMLINRGQAGQVSVLSEPSFRLMIQRLIDFPLGDGGDRAFYGYGLAIEEDEGHTIIGHDGGMVGYYTAMLADLDDGLGVVVLTNGPGEPAPIARFALKLLRAACHGRELPPLPPVAEPDQVDNACDYEGSYRLESRVFALAAEGQRLVMEVGGERIALEKRGQDRFYVPHPDLARFLLRFGRLNGQVVEAFHGPDWYITDRYTGPDCFEFPAAWRAYPGHYRAHNPWHTNFRIVARKGKLVLVEPWGDEELLEPLGDGVFRVGDSQHAPERIRFDTVLNGLAIRANLSRCAYYRTFTP